LAKISGLGKATIERIEGGHSQITLRTALRLCSSLKKELIDLLSALFEGQELPILEKRRPVVTDGTVINVDDLKAFLEVFSNRGADGHHIVRDMLDSLSMHDARRGCLKNREWLL
jgi:transcriptional regulator with XRE-family HTH domain